MNLLPTTRLLLRNVPLFSRQFLPAVSRTAFRPLSGKTTPPPPLSPQPPATENQKPPGTLDDIDPKEKSFIPRQLLRPLGLDFPPMKGENSGADSRTLQQKRDDFVNWDKHLEKRKRLSSEFGKSYFRDFNAMDKTYQGKTWIAPAKLFRADVSLYFPNFQGTTLVPPRKAIRDTTDILVTPSPGVISLAAVFSSAWGDAQAKSFTEHADVIRALEESKGKAQKVDVNIEENKMKALLITMFLPRLRRITPKDRHDKYFIVTKGVTDELRNHMGLVNGRVGYVYLVDTQGRIRWAASGTATDEEIQALVRGIQRLVGTVRTEEEVETKNTTVKVAGGAVAGAA